MSRAAFQRIEEGLREALAVARGEAEAYRTYYMQQPVLPAPEYVDPEKAAKKAKMDAKVDAAIAAGLLYGRRPTSPDKP
jgi:hypothetical protein